MSVYSRNATLPFISNEYKDSERDHDTTKKQELLLTEEESKVEETQRDVKSNSSVEK